eukprot:358848-Chlamydomonas_euryale.AAC.6
MWHLHAGRCDPHSADHCDLHRALRRSLLSLAHLSLNLDGLHTPRAPNHQVHKQADRTCKDSGDRAHVNSRSSERRCALRPYPQRIGQQ